MGIELAKTDEIYFLVGSAFIFMEEIVDHVVNAALHCGAIIHAYFSCFLRNTLSVFVEKKVLCQLRSILYGICVF